MTEMMVYNKDIEICTESFGDASDPAILLIMGATASMVWWDDRFCKKIADHGFYVIRYDNRDTGKSTCYSPGVPPYTVIDLADDALCILKSYKIRRVHLIGMSLGGMIAQIIAIRSSDKVKSLTLISTSVWDNIPDLPQMEPRLIEYYSKIPSIDWCSDDQAKDYIIGNWRNIHGSRHEFDETRASDLAEIEINRSVNIQCMFNHTLLGGGEELYGRSKEIEKPVLVIHGTEDPVLPFAHAKALEETFKNSKLVALHGLGHEIHMNEWDTIVDEIVKHITKS
jgi:pimeloyl-ACP methyl ester carboxylesterase